MKKVALISIAVALAVTTLMAQAPQNFNYQGVARDNTGNVLQNQSISIRITILSGSPTGASEYAETHSDTTNQFGLFTLQIGNGTVVSGDFTTINWGANTHYIKVEMDETGGANYQLMGTSQLLSVPYALHAENVTNDNVDDADADSTNELQTLSLTGNNLSISSGNTVTLTDNINDADADSTNELQAISISNDTIYLSNGGFLTLPPDQTADADADSTNELQTLSLSDDTLIISNGNSVILIDADSTNELQTLSISNDTISLSNGGFVKLPDMNAQIMSALNNVFNANFSCGDTFIDVRDGKIYTTVLIGTQCWMAENLNYGTYVPLATGQGGAGTQKYCYGNNTANCTTFGGLYEWAEIMDGAVSSNAVPSGVQGVCPVSWHIPSDAEWCIMENVVEAGTDPGCSLTGWRGINTGGKLKQTGTTNWITPNTGATNTSGFTALPGGYSWIGSFNTVGTWGYWWSATVSGTNAWGPTLYYMEARVRRGISDKLAGYSVRCVKD